METRLRVKDSRGTNLVVETVKKKHKYNQYTSKGERIESYKDKKGSLKTK